MSEELIKRMIEFLETASPHVWEVVSRQVLVVTVQSIFWFIITTVIAVFCAVWAKKEYAKHKRDSYDTHDINGVILAVLSVAAAIIAACLVSDIVAYLLNPDYRAIKMLLGLIK